MGDTEVKMLTFKLLWQSQVDITYRQYHLMYSINILGVPSLGTVPGSANTVMNKIIKG